MQWSLASGPHLVGKGRDGAKGRSKYPEAVSRKAYTPTPSPKANPALPYPVNSEF